jgi:transposase
MKWQDLSGEERYRVIEICRNRTKPLEEICETFAVSRQTLYRAMEAVDRASIEALQPKPAGRKPEPEAESRIKEMAKQKEALSREADHWKTKYEVATAFLELERKWERGQPLPGEGEKKKSSGRARRRQARAHSNSFPCSGQPARVEQTNDGRRDGHLAPGAGQVDEGEGG